MTVKDLMGILETVDPGLTVVWPGNADNDYRREPINYVAVWDEGGFSSAQPLFTPPGVDLAIEASDLKTEFEGNLIRPQYTSKQVKSLEDLL